MKFTFVALACLVAVSPAPLEACDTGNQLQHPVQGEIFRRFRSIDLKIFHALRLFFGVDYRGNAGEPVVAAEAGTVIFVDGQNALFGNYLRIDHGNSLKTGYGYLHDYNVKPGQCVSKGEVIGRLGNSSAAGGPSLHLEVFRDGKYIDPCDLLPAQRGCEIPEPPPDCWGRPCDRGPVPE